MKIQYCPKELIKYINTQTTLCPTCKEIGITARLSSQHLQKIHSIKVDSTEGILNEIQSLNHVYKKKNNLKVTRKELIIQKTKDLLITNIKKIECFLTINKRKLQSQ